MPELSDITVYCEQIASPFLLRSVDPSLEEFVGKKAVAVRRIGKRVVLELDQKLFLVIHLMIAGRFRWGAVGAKIPGKIGLAAFSFPSGTLLLTEAGPKKRASLYAVRGEEALETFDPGGLEVLEADFETFKAAIKCESHTHKRTLTDPHIFSGIGNAYSDEILWRARLSPVALSQEMDEDAIKRLYDATRQTFIEWTVRLRAEATKGFPSKVTAFRPEFAMHGKYNQPCPACGSPIQRIVYARNEANNCATCQTGGKLLADRAMSRLMKGDWPKTLEQLESRMAAHKKV